MSDSFTSLRLLLNNYNTPTVIKYRQYYYKGIIALQRRVLSGRIDPAKSEYQVLSYCLL